MTKIMLVEDDKSLREIYGVRLLAEGYDIVSAGDGEEALAMAIKERPALIVSDVMMPKISGFDMLDILRSTTETKNIRVIMMTALSSEEQRQRGETLGADRYLVKSQVGIEDVVRVNIADVRQQSTMNYLVQDHDVIFNLAGQVSHIDSIQDPYTDLEINRMAQEEAMRYIEQHSATQEAPAPMPAKAPETDKTQNV